MRYLSTGIPLVIQAHWFDNDKNRNVIEFNIFRNVGVCEHGRCMKNVEVKTHITKFSLDHIFKVNNFAGFKSSGMS